MALLHPPARRRERAARTAEASLRGGLLGAAAGAVAWIAAIAIGGTAFLVLLVATVAAAAYTLLRSRVSLTVWGLLAAGWAIVILERWAVHGHGGLWVAGAAWLGVIGGARRAGIAKRWLPLLAYPLLCAAVVVADHERLLSPWGTSWLWVGAVLGPVIGVRTLLSSSRSGSRDTGGR